MTIAWLIPLPLLSLPMIDGTEDASAIAKDVRDGKTSALDVIQKCLRRIEAHDVRVNAFTEVHTERAILQAQSVDERVAQGQLLPLAGAPFAAKNLFDVADHITLAGSKINRARSKADKDSLMIQRLEQAGGVLVGSLNMGEYAYDFTGENAHYGNCCNPWDENRMAGGSSSGSGAALAAGCVSLTLGTDTNGSIRVPSSFCGVWGLKPTFGRLPRTGIFPFCHSLDHVGIMSRCVNDLIIAYRQLEGHDDSDPVCIPSPPSPAIPDKPLRVGLAGGYFADGSFPEAEAAARCCAEALARAGHSLHEVNLEHVEQSRAAAFLITNFESAQLHFKRLQTQADDFDPDTRDRLLAGSLLPGNWYLKAQRARQVFARTTHHLMANIDLLIAPCTPMIAPELGTKTMVLGKETVGLRANIGYFTQPISCIGLPVVAAPATRLTGELPLGVQLIGKHWCESHCLRAAQILEELGVCGSKIATNFIEE